MVLIEANGTTDPTALLEHLLVNPGLRNRFAPLLQVAVVDTQRWQRRHWHNELEHLQVETASHILFTREDEVPKERFAQVRADIEWLNPKAEWIKRQTLALTIERIATGFHRLGPGQPGHGAHSHPTVPAGSTSTLGTMESTRMVVTSFPMRL